MDFYRKELGIRRYKTNDKKYKFDRENSYGKGGSRMDLHYEEAQGLLNKVVYKKAGCMPRKMGTIMHCIIVDIERKT